MPRACIPDWPQNLMLVPSLFDSVYIRFTHKELFDRLLHLLFLCAACLEHARHECNRIRHAATADKDNIELPAIRQAQTV